MNQCYDKISIFYRNAIFFVDPITPQIYPDARVQNCSDRIENFFQFDMEDENTWFTLTHTLEHRKQPAVIGPKDVTLVSKKALVEQEMLESTHEHSYLNSGTKSLSAPLRRRLYKNFLENLPSPTQQFMDQNNVFIMLRTGTSM